MGAYTPGGDIGCVGDGHVSAVTTGTAIPGPADADADIGIFRLKSGDTSGLAAPAAHALRPNPMRPVSLGADHAGVVNSDVPPVTSRPRSAPDDNAQLQQAESAFPAYAAAAAHALRLDAVGAFSGSRNHAAVCDIDASAVAAAARITTH